MKQFGLLFFILVFIITGCATETDLGANSNIELQNKKGAEEQNKIPKEMPDDQKSVDSNLIEILNYTIVKRIYEDDDYDSYWKKIEMSDGRVGYVIGDNIRSPIDYRVGFEKVNNDWKITSFLAGD